MRKTLAVLVLMISSMLLLQAPAWAPPEPDHHLYKIDTTNSFEALTDCPPTSVVRIRPNPAADAVRARSEGTKAFGGVQRNRFVFDTGARFSPAKLQATCDGKRMKVVQRSNLLGTSVPLAFTGRSLVPQLLLGMGLLLVGGLFVVLTGQPPLGVFRRRRARPASSG